jgi:hypothetical protein
VESGRLSHQERPRVIQSNNVAGLYNPVLTKKHKKIKKTNTLEYGEDTPRKKSISPVKHNKSY